MGKKWKMPKWMEPYRPLICNTGGNSVEDLMNGHSDARVNLPLAVLESCVISQVKLLTGLQEQGQLSKAIAAPKPLRKGYSAAYRTKLEEEFLGPVERGRLGKAPAWVRSLVSEMLKEIENLRAAPKRQRGE